MAAKKSTKSSKALVHPAALKAMCPPVTASFRFPAGWSLSEGSWRQLTSLAGSTFLYWEGGIDLGAYTLKDLTWVTQAKAIQEPGNFQLNFASPQRLEFIEFVSNTPFNLARMTLIADNWETGGAVPGMMNSVVNYENIIVGRWRQFSQDTTLPGGSAITLKLDSFGSSEPSASDKLYSYCLVKFDPLGLIQEEDSVFIPGRRFILGGAAVQEGDLEYVMRLRRSYVLQE